jgi:hypothetical protein
MCAAMKGLGENKKNEALFFALVSHFSRIEKHYKKILNAALRNIFKRKNVICALYHVLSNWSRGTNFTRHRFRKTPTNSHLSSANPKNDHHHHYHQRAPRSSRGM